MGQRKVMGSWSKGLPLVGLMMGIAVARHGIHCFLLYWLWNSATL